MRRSLLIVAMVLLLFGCGASVRDSGFYERQTHFASWSHLKFSLWGYKNPTAADVEKSKKEGWWGETVEIRK